MDQLIGHSITYRIAVGPQAGRKVFHPANPAGQRGGVRATAEASDSTMLKTDAARAAADPKSK
jgi:hypothetical protein